MSTKKGTTMPVSFRVPIEVYDVLIEKANEANCTLSEYLFLKLCDNLDNGSVNNDKQYNKEKIARLTGYLSRKETQEAIKKRIGLYFVETKPILISLRKGDEHTFKGTDNKKLSVKKISSHQYLVS